MQSSKNTTKQAIIEAGLPLVFVGFPPQLIFFGLVVVLAYQT